MRTKSNLDNARRNKNDEYYTYYEDIEKYTRLVIRRNLRCE
nr:MAG TPA: adenine-specific methyltransferase [Caudoviricetes sp.]